MRESIQVFAFVIGWSKLNDRMSTEHTAIVISKEIRFLQQLSVNLCLLRLTKLCKILSLTRSVKPPVPLSSSFLWVLYMELCSRDMLSLLFKWDSLRQTSIRQRAWTCKMNFNQINFNVSTILLDDRSHYLSRIGKEALFPLGPFLPNSFGVSSCEWSRTPYSLWNSTGSFKTFHTCPIW